MTISAPEFNDRRKPVLNFDVVGAPALHVLTTQYASTRIRGAYVPAYFTLHLEGGELKLPLRVTQLGDDDSEEATRDDIVVVAVYDRWSEDLLPGLKHDWLGQDRVFVDGTYALHINLRTRKGKAEISGY